MEPTKSWFDIVLAIMNWPFLLFVGVAIFVYIYRRKVGALLERGDIQISWGEHRHIKLKDLSDGIDEELNPLQEEIQLLKDRVSVLENNNRDGVVNENLPVIEMEIHNLNEAVFNEAKERMLEGLKVHKYRWRTIGKLASMAGISEKTALDILRASSSEVILSVGKSGNQIARHVSR